MTTAELSLFRQQDTVFLGHPRGLAWLSGSEFWERFSYYGMQALLVLYMTHRLLLPGHVEHVAGFRPFRAAIEAVYGPLSAQALASAIFGLYAGLVYATPILGGILADRVIGRTSAVTLGAVLMAAGHFLMAFDASFLLALLCLLVGVGCFKGNIAAQVGDLYPSGDPRRADAFQIYMLGIQLAVIGSPIACGTLGEVYGWHWGFGLAGVGMLVGLAVYLSGRRWLPPDPPIRRGSDRQPRVPLSAAERRCLAVLLALLPVLAVCAIGNNQIFNAYMVWAEANYQLVVFGMRMPVTWLLSLGSIISAATMAGSVLFWQWWARRRPEPDEITKLAIGATIAATAPLVLALASALQAAGGGKIGLGWAVLFQLVNDTGFANVFPVGLALFSRASPKPIAGTMIGIYYLHLFAANMLVGWLGGFLEVMPATAFWLLHAALVFAGAVALILLRPFVARLLTPVPETMHSAAGAPA